MADPTDAPRADAPSRELPEQYDRLVSTDKLVHGAYNPRRVRPSEELQTSIEESGICRPLIVRSDAESDVYHITDGWQRYQAATSCGYEELPVLVFESAVAALTATESESIVNEWSTYEWATFCSALAEQFSDEVQTQQQLVSKVSQRTVKSERSVRRYLQVLELPEEVHPLLKGGPDGSEQSWAALKNFDKSVRRYNGLSWNAAEHLARRQGSLSRERVVGTAAMAVEFSDMDDAVEFITTASERSNVPLSTIREEVLFGQHHAQYLEVPSVTVQLEPKSKRALMDYCHEERQSLSELVSREISSLASEIETADSSSD